MINYNLCVRDAKLQSCGCIPSMINYNLCVRERVGKKERTKYNLIKAKSLRKKETNKQLQLDQSKGESEMEIKKQVMERDRETNKQTKERNGLKLEEDISLFSHYAYVRALLLLYHIT